MTLSSWWQNAVIYHVYLRSFVDSNGDGIGDIRGLISKLDYLQWLGVDAVWCSPVTASANRDLGYDVTDYLGVEPTLGTSDDLDELIAQATEHGMRVLLDFVPNHTSSDHPWFRDSEKRRDYYIWRDEPNNWISTFHIPMWTRHPDEDRYYLHSYLPGQPDLNWRNEQVRQEFDRIIQYWFDRGVAGFRVDACYLLLKDELLRDNPVATKGDHPWDRHRGQRPVHNSNHPDVHELLRRWRRIADSYDEPRLLTGSTWIPDVNDLVAYFGDGDELHLPQDSQFLFSDFEPDALRSVVENWLGVMKPDFTPIWIGSNHDFSRLATRWCEGNPAKIKLALAMMLTLPGACVLYQGDELGLEDVYPDEGHLQDAAGLFRDLSRSPMPWRNEKHGGFTDGIPWLPLGDVKSCNVEQQRTDPHSILSFSRDMIALKKQLWGDYEPLTSRVDDGLWSYRRGNKTIHLDFETNEVRIEQDDEH